MAGRGDLDLVRVNVGDSERTRLYKEMLKSNTAVAASAHTELRKSTDRLKNGGNSRLGTPAAFVGRGAAAEDKKEAPSLSKSASAGSVSKIPYNLDRLRSTVRRDSRCVAHVPELEHLLRSTAVRVEAICNRLEQADAEALGAKEEWLQKAATGPAHGIQIIRRGQEPSGKEKRARADAVVFNDLSQALVFKELDSLEDTLSEPSFVCKSGKRFADRVPPFQGLAPELLTLTEALERAQGWEKDGCAGFCFEGNAIDEDGRQVELMVSFRAAPESGAADNWPDTALDFDEAWTTYERKGMAFKHLREFFPKNFEPHPYLPLLHDHALHDHSNFQKVMWGEPCLPSADSGLRAGQGGPRGGPTLGLPRVTRREVPTPLAGRRIKRDKSVWF